MVPDVAGRRDPNGPLRCTRCAACRAADRPAGTRGDPVRPAYFLLRRWMRVFFSSLRCFFLAILLRRFLMTEPTKLPSLDCTEDGHATVPAQMRAAGHRPGVVGYRAGRSGP